MFTSGTVCLATAQLPVESAHTIGGRLLGHSSTASGISPHHRRRICANCARAENQKACVISTSTFSNCLSYTLDTSNGAYSRCNYMSPWHGVTRRIQATLDAGRRGSIQANLDARRSSASKQPSTPAGGAGGALGAASCAVYRAL